MVLICSDFHVIQKLQHFSERFFYYMAHPTHRYILKWSKMITPKVRHLAFSREDKASFSFVAGQFITLHIEGPTKILHRSYSIANTPQQDDTIEIACAYVEGGVATGLLFGMQVGDPILASGPYGLFVLKEERPARYLFIATGTGVTPYRSMLNDIKERFKHSHPELEVVLILGVRNSKELLFAEEFVAFAKANPRFKFYTCYSRETSPVTQSFEHHGHVQDLLQSLNLAPLQDIVYLCGNPNMIDDTFNLLTGMGFEKKSVRREKYLFSH